MKAKVQDWEQFDRAAKSFHSPYRSALKIRVGKAKVKSVKATAEKGRHRVSWKAPSITVKIDGWSKKVKPDWYEGTLYVKTGGKWRPQTDKPVKIPATGIGSNVPGKLKGKAAKAMAALVLHGLEPARDLRRRDAEVAGNAETCRALRADVEPARFERGTFPSHGRAAHPPAQVHSPSWRTPHFPASVFQGPVRHADISGKDHDVNDTAKKALSASFAAALAGTMAAAPVVAAPAAGAAVGVGKAQAITKAKLKKQVKKYKKQATSYKSKSRALKAQVSTLKTKNSTLQAKLAAALDDSALQDRIDSLSEQLREVESERDDLQAALDLTASAADRALEDALTLLEDAPAASITAQYDAAESLSDKIDVVSSTYRSAADTLAEQVDELETQVKELGGQAEKDEATIYRQKCNIYSKKFTDAKAKLKVTAGSKQFKASWAALKAIAGEAAPSGSAVSYQVGYRLSTASSYTIADVASTSYTKKGLKSGKKYKVRVRALVKADPSHMYYSSWTGAVTITTKA